MTKLYPDLTDGYEWIPGYEGSYMINREAKIYSTPKQTQAGNFIQWVEIGRRNGDFAVGLYKDGKRKKVNVKKVMLELFDIKIKFHPKQKVREDTMYI